MYNFTAGEMTILAVERIESVRFSLAENFDGKKKDSYIAENKPVVRYEVSDGERVRTNDPNATEAEIAALME